MISTDTAGHKGIGGASNRCHPPAIAGVLLIIPSCGTMPSVPTLRFALGANVAGSAGRPSPRRATSMDVPQPDRGDSQAVGGLGLV